MRPLLPAAIEFQPDARQIEELRPPWLERTTVHVLMLVVILALGWAAVAKVDRVVVASGKLLTTRATLVLQPLETSVVRSLEAKVGEQGEARALKVGDEVDPGTTLRSAAGTKAALDFADGCELRIAERSPPVVRRPCIGRRRRTAALQRGDRARQRKAVSVRPA